MYGHDTGGGAASRRGHGLHPDVVLLDYVVNDIEPTRDV